MRQLILLLFLFSLGCAEPSKEEDNSGFVSQLKDLGDRTAPEFYLIIPIKGCSACVDEALTFMRTRLYNSQITFVLASNENKVIDLTVSAAEKEATNVILDRKNVLNKSGLLQSSLVLLRLDKDKRIHRKTLRSDSLTFILDKLYQATSRAQTYYPGDAK